MMMGQVWIKKYTFNESSSKGMKNKELSGASSESVSVIAPARLHLGFLDMHGGLGRQFGSLGLCLSNIYTHLTAKKSDDIVIHGPSSQRGTEYVSRIFNALKIAGGVDITIYEEIPEHAGLGSGTQLSLAIGMAISRDWHWWIFHGWFSGRRWQRRVNRSSPHSESFLFSWRMASVIGFR